VPSAHKVPRPSGDRMLPNRLQGHDVEGALVSGGQHDRGGAAFAVPGRSKVLRRGRHTAEEHIGYRCSPSPRWVLVSGILCGNQYTSREFPATVTTRAEAAQYLKDAGGLKLVVFGADGHEVAAMFVQGSVTYDEEEATFIAVAEDGQTVGELFVDETVGYDGNTDAFVIRAA
jgi:hypothetical protein